MLITATGAPVRSPAGCPLKGISALQGGPPCCGGDAAREEGNPRRTQICRPQEMRRGSSLRRSAVRSQGLCRSDEAPPEIRSAMYVLRRASWRCSVA